MDTFEMSGDRTPLGDMTNIISGCQNSSNTRLQLIDHANERKRERERARYATMSDEKKMEINKKRHEAHGNAALNNENVDLDENNNWLHTNESYQPQLRNVDNENKPSNRYKRMTPTAKKARNEQQRLHNKTRGRKMSIVKLNLGNI
ncbi:hypothetical protein PAHAL_5G459700 [Panicum hallii]|uniref:Uncharacterized protein n=1 Tax=Panicum hallii TaxID=206008 RepID=A0A2T8INI0_9POAL|nr:hypothetical protein PAHAL_5G459700 [Panicum hallii]